MLGNFSQVFAICRFFSKLTFKENQEYNQSVIKFGSKSAMTLVITGGEKVNIDLGNLFYVLTFNCCTY